VLAANITSCSGICRRLRINDTDPNHALDNIQIWDPFSVAHRHGSKKEAVKHAADMLVHDEVDVCEISNEAHTCANQNSSQRARIGSHFHSITFGTHMPFRSLIYRSTAPR
jgi:hypothetical protein